MRYQSGTCTAGMYKTGSFHFTFAINNNYPHDPPKVKCTQKIYHPNLDHDGNVCLNILREDWKPVLNLNSVMVGLQYLFLEPNADDPLNKGELFWETLEKLLFKAEPLTDLILCRGGRGSAKRQARVCEQCQAKLGRRKRQ